MGLDIEHKMPLSHPWVASISRPAPLTVMNIRVFEHWVYPGVHDLETNSGSKTKDSLDLPRMSLTKSPSASPVLGSLCAQSQPSGVFYVGWAVMECIKLFFL